MWGGMQAHRNLCWNLFEGSRQREDGTEKRRQTGEDVMVEGRELSQDLGQKQ